MPWVVPVSRLAGESWGLLESDREEAREDRGVGAEAGSDGRGAVHLFCPEPVPSAASSVGSRSGSICCGGGVPGPAQDL